MLATSSKVNNGCPSTAKVTQRYRNAPHITRHVWGPGNEGVEVVLMEMAGKGHWISNDYGVLTGDEIWKFCSRYSVDVVYPAEKPQVVIDQRFTSIEEASGKKFAIVNEADGMALYGSDNQNLGNRADRHRHKQARADSVHSQIHRPQAVCGGRHHPRRL